MAVAPESERAWRVWFCAAAVMLASGCTLQPEASILEPLADNKAVMSTASRLDALLPADVLLIGEQHDAQEHQRIEQQIVATLAARAQLAALTLEMADAGASTAQLKPGATQEQVRRALNWDDKRWPWAAYGPAVMSAVRAGVPVLGANLARSQMPASMANGELDKRLPAAALKTQQQAIRVGHCHLLPEKQIIPMTRIQIAKDITMAATIEQAVLPGKVVVLLAGKGHVDRTLGVPQHLPGTLRARAIGLQAGVDKGQADLPQAFDTVWITPALPQKDHCAELRTQWRAGGR